MGFIVPIVAIQVPPGNEQTGVAVPPAQTVDMPVMGGGTGLMVIIL